MCERESRGRERKSLRRGTQPRMMSLQQTSLALQLLMLLLLLLLLVWCVPPCSLLVARYQAQCFGTRGNVADFQVHLSQSFEDDGVSQLRWRRNDADLAVTLLPKVPSHLCLPAWLAVPAADAEQSAVQSSRDASAGQASAKLLPSLRDGDDEDDDWEPLWRLLRRKTKL